jgi:hypothetical protein
VLNVDDYYSTVILTPGCCDSQVLHHIIVLPGSNQRSRLYIKQVCIVVITLDYLWYDHGSEHVLLVGASDCLNS